MLHATCSDSVGTILVPLHFALRNIHFPSDAMSLEKARYRLKFEELFYLQLSLLKQKYVRSREENGIAMPRVGEAFNRCYEALPFPLTGAQKRVITEIRNDMKSGRQMNRLLPVSRADLTPAGSRNFCIFLKCCCARTSVGAIMHA